MREIRTRPGLTEPVHGSQRIFKAVLEAVSRPGKLVKVFDLPPSPYAEAAPAGGKTPGRGLTGGMSRGLTALALALCDQDTPIWLDSACDDAETRHHLRFHCGSPLVKEPAGAVFAFVGDATRLPRLHEFSRGMPEYPDCSATLIIRAVLGGPAGERFEFNGPGARDAVCLIQGLPVWFRKSWQDNHAGYPLGVDALFVDDRGAVDPLPHFKILGLPRGVSFESARRPRSYNRENLQCMSR
ncbi:MAG: phosphonate C-P lyase system protein PhnH [Deltaproteobacteria bacterium]|jgi:alpha-D-ribose 1-methylphosphonate 5-triphosphate synthase subunit PhnH|nr:phosphonate C-P lyase system protein PhnH [Deltaproteobacteria bacterium]